LRGGGTPQQQQNKETAMRNTLFMTKTTLVVFCLCLGLITGNCIAKESNKKEATGWTDSFNLQECSFSTIGKTKYFILEPGYQLTLEGIDGKDSVKLVIAVLNETQKIGDTETRIVEEKETVNGEITEVSHNFYAICTQINSVFYFGEDVDIYKDGKIIDHSGSWRTDSGNAKAGLMMPGMILLGAKYYQEIAPGIAMDRAEIISTTETLQTTAGKFEGCLKTEETSSVEPKSKEYKFYAPGIGLLKDGELLLTKYGYIKE
jgi:hypothetical protein